MSYHDNPDLVKFNCKKCHGTGMMPRQSPLIKTQPCDKCNGSGEVIRSVKQMFEEITKSGNAKEN